ncbi:hypothetical protein J6590_106496 [Homalodisca vitripennis]|nr:hypothetical protein J6590_106496 [Homalodisca vitripennis]
MKCFRNRLPLRREGVGWGGISQLPLRIIQISWNLLTVEINNSNFAPPPDSLPPHTASPGIIEIFSRKSHLELTFHLRNMMSLKINNADKINNLQILFSFSVGHSAQGAVRETELLGYDIPWMAYPQIQERQKRGQSPPDGAVRETELLGYDIPWMAYPQIQERQKKGEARVLQTVKDGMG